jgi:hypothetical protein
MRGMVRRASVSVDLEVVRSGVRSVMAPAANSAATASAEVTEPVAGDAVGAGAGITTAGAPPHAAAAAARPASGPAITIRSAPCAACAIAWAKSTGRLTCLASSSVMSSSAVTRCPVMVEISLRCGAAACVPAKTLRSGATYLAMAGECMARIPARTSTGTPSEPARLASSRMPAVDPARTCAPGPS